jgi:hypothetical protein
MTRQREYSRPVSAPNGSGGIRVSRTPTLTQPPSSARITARTVNPAMTHCRFSISFRIGSSASGWSSTRVAGCAGTYGCHQTAHALLLGDELRVHPDCTLCGATFHRRGAALVQALQVLPPPYSRASGRGKGRRGGGGVGGESPCLASAALAAPAAPAAASLAFVAGASAVRASARAPADTASSASNSGASAPGSNLPSGFRLQHYKITTL